MLFILDRMTQCESDSIFFEVNLSPKPSMLACDCIRRLDSFMESDYLRVFVARVPDKITDVEELIYSSDQPALERGSDPREPAKMVNFKNLRRRILSSVLDCAPDKLNFSYTNGKPGLTEFEGFYFNTSYSGSRMVIACANSPIGVDLEEIAIDSADENVAETLFHRSEIDHIIGKSGLDWTRTFLASWTQKETFAKALGMGFGIEFSDFAVSPAGVLIKCETLDAKNRP